LLGACLDGINAEGPTVSLMGNVDLQNRCLPEPTLQSGVGLYELQVPRLLLDTCATVEEAKRALLLNKQYYWMMPSAYYSFRLQDDYGTQASSKDAPFAAASSRPISLPSRSAATR
jgi:hypothetical protein